MSAVALVDGMDGIENSKVALLPLVDGIDGMEKSIVDGSSDGIDGIDCIWLVLLQLAGVVSITAVRGAIATVGTGIADGVRGILVLGLLSVVVAVELAMRKVHPTNRLLVKCCLQCYDANKGWYYSEGFPRKISRRIGEHYTVIYLFGRPVSGCLL